MNYVMYNISNEEMTDKATNVFEAMAKQCERLHMDDAVCVIGFALTEICAGMSETTGGKVDADYALGAIYHKAAEALKFRKKMN